MLLFIGNEVKAILHYLPKYRVKQKNVKIDVAKRYK